MALSPSDIAIQAAIDGNLRLLKSKRALPTVAVARPSGFG
jgi:hypothetical protein